MTTTDDDHALLTLRTGAAADTKRLGERLGVHLQSGDVLCLVGNLGAGKTCLTQGLAQGWGALERPTSPTFTLINEYHRASDTQRFFHVDCYRLANSAEAWTAGLDDVFDAAGVVVIEWAERIRDILPTERLWIQLHDLGGNSRQLTLEATGKRAVALSRALQDWR